MSLLQKAGMRVLFQRCVARKLHLEQMTLEIKHHQN